VAKIICGVDVASRSLEVRIRSDGPAHSFANSPEGIADLATFCHHHHVDLVARQATGGYEQQPFSLLWADGIPALLLHPQAVRRFAQSLGLLEKTDRSDASLIAWFPSVQRFAPLVPPSAHSNISKPWSHAPAPTHPSANRPAPSAAPGH
jgi:transposase